MYACVSASVRGAYVHSCERVSVFARSNVHKCACACVRVFVFAYLHICVPACVRVYVRLWRKNKKYI